MTALFSAPRMPVHHSVLRFVHDRNPFYLLSALCMFVGFRVVLGALNSAPGDWKTLLELIVTLQVYEVVIMSLALFLITRRGLRRDGWILLGIEALFLVDLTNLNAELFTAMPRLGSVVNGVCFMLAMMRIFIVLRVLGLRVSGGVAFYIAVQLALLLGLPGLFRVMQSSMSTVSAMQIYWVWWLVALMMVLGSIIMGRRPANEHSAMSALPWRLYVVLPLISLLVHLASENRVYWVHFQLANIAPVLLALVAGINQTKWRYHPSAVGWSLGLVIFSAAFSFVPADYQVEMSARFMHMTISPLRLGFLGAGVTLGYVAIMQQSVLAAALLCIGAPLVAIYTHLTQILDFGQIAYRWLESAIIKMIPETDLGWGYAAIVSAFLLLAMGAIVSLCKAAPSSLTEEMPT